MEKGEFWVIPNIISEGIIAQLDIKTGGNRKRYIDKLRSFSKSQSDLGAQDPELYAIFKDFEWSMSETTFLRALNATEKRGLYIKNGNLSFLNLLCRFAYGSNWSDTLLQFKIDEEDIVKRDTYNGPPKRPKIKEEKFILTFENDFWQDAIVYLKTANKDSPLIANDELPCNIEPGEKKRIYTYIFDGLQSRKDLIFEQYALTDNEISERFTKYKKFRDDALNIVSDKGLIPESIHLIPTLMIEAAGYMRPVLERIYKEYASVPIDNHYLQAYSLIDKMLEGQQYCQIIYKNYGYHYWQLHKAFANLIFHKVCFEKSLVTETQLYKVEIDSLEVINDFYRIYSDRSPAPPRKKKSWLLELLFGQFYDRKYKYRNSITDFFK